MRTGIFVAAALMAQSAYADDVIVTLLSRTVVPIVTLADNGKTIPLKVDRCVNVHLSSNTASTGYQWAMAHDSTELMTLESQSTTPPTVPMPGRPSSLTFLLCAVEPGTGAVKFELTRSWEKNIAPTKTLMFKVKIER